MQFSARFEKLFFSAESFLDKDMKRCKDFFWSLSDFEDIGEKRMVENQGECVVLLCTVDYIKSN